MARQRTEKSQTIARKPRGSSIISSAACTSCCFASAVTRPPQFSDCTAFVSHMRAEEVQHCGVGTREEGRSSREWTGVARGARLGTEEG